MIELYEICYKKIGYEWKIMTLNPKKKKVLLHSQCNPIYIVGTVGKWIF